MNEASPLGRLAHIDFRSGPSLLDIVGVILFVLVVGDNALGHFPKLLGAEAELVVGVRFVPKDLVLEAVGFRIVVDDQALVIFCALVHDLAKRLKRRKHTRVVVKNTLAVGNVGLAQNKDVIDVCSQCRWDTQWVLHGNDENDLPVTAVHKEEPHHLVS